MKKWFLNYINKNRFVYDLGCIQLVVSTLAAISLLIAFFYLNELDKDALWSTVRGLLVGLCFVFLGSEFRYLTEENDELEKHNNHIIKAYEKTLRNSYKSRISKNVLEQIRDKLEKKKELSESEKWTLNLVKYNLEVITNKV